MTFSSLKKATIPLLFGISCLVTYAGAVNQGATSFFAAVPFVALLSAIAIRYKGKYIIGATCTLLICSGLYFLKAQQTPVFYPALGESVKVAKSACLTSYSNTSSYLFVGEVFGGGCPEDFDDYPLSGVKAIANIHAGSIYTITESGVSHPDFAERYFFVVETEHGQVKVSPGYPDDHGVFEKMNGEPVEESDLRRTIFYYPSQLLYWPILPVILSTIVI